MEKCYVRGVLDEGFGKEVSNREREAARLPALRSDAAQGAHPQAPQASGPVKTLPIQTHSGRLTNIYDDLG